MNKYQKTIAKLLSAYVLIVLILLPRIILTIVDGSMAMWIWKFAFLLLFFVSTFSIFVWLIFDKNLDTKKSASIKKAKKLKLVQMFSRVALFIVAVIILFWALVPLGKDAVYLASGNPAVEVDGIISSERHPGLGFLFKLQFMTLGNDHNYYSIYTTDYVRGGEKYRLLTLPNSHYVLDVEKL